MAASEIVVPSHPYYPINIKLVGYIPNEYGVLELVSMFGAGCAVILAATLCVVQFTAPKIRGADKLAVLWFVLTASIHLWFEGYFAYNHTRMPAMTDLFGQLWKEYSHADSRYLTSDPFVLCMETITAALWGPLSYFLIYLILKESPYRHPIQMIVSGGQIYGDILYYSTSWFNEHFFGLNYCRPEAYYYWFYYFFMNFIWLIVPGYYLQDSVKTIASAFRKLNVLEGSQKKR
ncbi:EBP domain-containing protein [Ascosphaera apis ARSEF 7405]|uniref:EBP domain-containing protein n=1 Tax=Ascosphaera apis ARSEF 7405 TaxID=392613 RepID=A0A168AKL3_9EURO|nr:EBP domain-containing protein [Ascosphaera apis ARSEF 7405]